MAFNGDSSSKRQRVDYDQAKAPGDSSFYQGNELRRKRPAPDNHILLLTVFTPAYPITTDVLHTICEPHGKVFRIVIFKKNGVQAMVEFDSIESAKRAKEALDGADIYAGCCTLKIEFAKPTKLNVYKNDMDSWDYTAPISTTPNKSVNSPRGPLLQEPLHYGARPTPFMTQRRLNNPSQINDPEDFEYMHDVEQNFGGGPGPAPPISWNSPEFNDYNDGPGYNDYDSYDNNGRNFGKSPVGREMLRTPSGPIASRMFGNRSPATGSGMLSTPNGAPPQSAVVMVYGLDPQNVNCDKLFNLFCLYGNVVKIKFLKSKEGCAMIQMSDAVAVERCIANLNNVNLNCGEMQLGHSKQIFLSDVMYPFNLPDGSPSFKSFVSSQNNRFMNPQMAAKNRITPPSKILHFFNTPINMNEEKITQLIEEKNVNPPVKAAMIPPKGDRSSSGLLEFANIKDSVDALMACNHMPIKSEGSNFPYTMKLCFSSSRSINFNKMNKKDQFD